MTADSMNEAKADMQEIFQQSDTEVLETFCIVLMYAWYAQQSRHVRTAFPISD